MKDYIKEKLASVPLKAGVYLMMNGSGVIIYIGKAKYLKNRISSYFSGSAKDTKTNSLVSYISDFDYIVVNNEIDALILENNLIKKHKPYYNILLKDGKRYPYILITTNDDFPKIKVVRKIEKNKGKYFGPFILGFNVWDLVEAINYTFMIRTCNLNLNNKRKIKKPCLNYSLGYCTAPCVGFIEKDSYRKAVEEVIDFLNGNTNKITQMLNDKMINAGKIGQFEIAIKYRDILNKVNRLKEKNTTELKSLKDIDIFYNYDNGINNIMTIIMIRKGKWSNIESINLGNIRSKIPDSLETFIMQYYNGYTIVPDEIILQDCPYNIDNIVKILSEQKGKNVKIIKPMRGIKKRLLELAKKNSIEYVNKNTKKLKIKEDRTIGALDILKDKLNLVNIPYRIECFDISNISGHENVASMAVFINGVPSKSAYRKYKIRTVSGANDFESMYEVISRRFKKNNDKEENIPDLVVIDGGKGQLSSSIRAIRDSGIFKTKVISIAKKQEEIYVAGQKEPIIINKSNYGLQLLIRIRDEAHRFAVNYHRSLRLKNNRSDLENINGIGPFKTKTLFKKFKTITKIKNASIEELSSTQYISIKDAKNIKKHYKNNNS